MAPSVTEATPSDPRIAAQIHAVARAAYALEAERIAVADFPPLRESLDELRQSTDRFLVVQQDGHIAGTLSFDRGPESVTITRLVVRPTHLRQGIATALLAELHRLLPPATPINVSTAKANAPAIHFYRRHGFAETGASTSSEGIPLLYFTHARRIADAEARLP